MLTPRRLAVALLLPLLAAALVACGSSGGSSSSPSSPAAGASLTDTAWTLKTSSLDVKVPDGVSVTADFTATNVSGSSGCNNYNGGYTATASGSLAFGPLAGTLKACEPPVDAVETAYRTALDKVAAYKIEGDELTMSDSSGAALLRYTRTTATASP